MAASAATDGVAAAALRSVIQRVHLAAERSGRLPDRIRIVAVSKTKPVPVIRQVYDAGHRYFGENYVQEIVEKAAQLPDDIEWHFIGNLQSNKVKPLLAGVPNLAMVESVDDKKIADRLDRMVGSMGRRPLKVFVQVNTSGEESKSGVEPEGCLELVKHISQNCTNLEFCGLMTIGMPDYTSTPENFKTLANCRSEACTALGIPEDQCDLWECPATLSLLLKWAAPMSGLGPQYLVQGNIRRRTNLGSIIPPVLKSMVIFRVLSVMF